MSTETNAQKSFTLTGYLEAVEAFNTGKQIGQEIQKEGKDGLEGYKQNIQCQFDNAKKVGEWKTTDDIKPIILGIETAGEDGEQVAHFLDKIWGIPRTEMCNLKRVAQLGYNLGQLWGMYLRLKKSKKMDEYRFEQIRSHIENRMMPNGFSLDTYFNPMV